MRPFAIKWLLLTLGLYFNSTSAQNFFTSVTYRGAFGATDWTQSWTNWNSRNTSYPSTTLVAQGSITQNTTWTANQTYLLKGYVYVTNGATLTIEPGTVIRCEDISSATLIITRGSKINAQGTALAPIVFTSAQPAGSRNYGDWGGIVILGKAKINASGGSADVGAGINNTGGDGLFGGSDDEDSSGVMHYVRIEFGGIQYQPDKEINSFTLAGVGSKTSIHNIQVSFSGNDAFRFAGGTAKAKYLVAQRTYDSDFTFDLGFKGSLQFGLALRDSSKASASGSSSIEVQNDGLASGATPITDPTLSNFTLLGPLTTLTTPYNSNYRYGVHIRRNTRLGLFNSAIAGYPRGIMLDGPGCGTQMKNGYIFLENTILSGNKVKQVDTTGKISITLPGFDFFTWLTEPGMNNKSLSNPKDLKLNNPYIYNAPLFIPLAGSPVLTGASFSHSRLSATTGIHTMAKQSHLNAHLSEGALQLFTDIEARNASITVFDMCGKTLYRTTGTKLKDSKIQLSETHHTVILSVCFEDGSCLNQLVPSQP